MMTSRMCCITTIVTALMSNSLHGSQLRRFIPQADRLVRSMTSSSIFARQALTEIFNRHNHPVELTIDEDSSLSFKRSAHDWSRILIPEQNLALPQIALTAEDGHSWAHRQRSNDFDARPFSSSALADLAEQEKLREELANRLMLWLAFSDSSQFDDFAWNFCLVRVGAQKLDLCPDNFVLSGSAAGGLIRQGLAISGEVKLRVGMTEHGWPIAYAALYRLGHQSLAMAAATDPRKTSHAADDHRSWRWIRDDNDDLGL